MEACCWALLYPPIHHLIWTCSIWKHAAEHSSTRLYVTSFEPVRYGRVLLSTPLHAYPSPHLNLFDMEECCWALLYTPSHHLIWTCSIWKSAAEHCSTGLSITSFAPVQYGSMPLSTPLHAYPSPHLHLFDMEACRWALLYPPNHLICSMYFYTLQINWDLKKKYTSDAGNERELWHGLLQDNTDIQWHLAVMAVCAHWKYYISGLPIVWESKEHSRT
jgi:hypothetical protein